MVRMSFTLHVRPRAASSTELPALGVLCYAPRRHVGLGALLAQRLNLAELVGVQRACEAWGVGGRSAERKQRAENVREAGSASSLTSAGESTSSITTTMSTDLLFLRASASCAPTRCPLSRTPHRGPPSSLARAPA
jgi:hypothetical protein